VAADLELNTLDRRQMPLTWHLLPEPIVLRMLQHAGGALADRLASAVLVLRAVRAAAWLCRRWRQLRVKAPAGM
jgi:hypothetical protein